MSLLKFWDNNSKSIINAVVAGLVYIFLVPQSWKDKIKKGIKNERNNS